jgi:Htaa
LTARHLLRAPLTLALVAALALGAAACGDDDDDSAEPATTAAPATLALTGESTSLTLDAATAAVLEDNAVAVTPVAPAAAEGGAIAFPITGGTVEAESLAGTIDHSGGLAFAAGGTTLEATDFVIDTVAGTLTATIGGDQVPLLNVDLAGLQRGDDAGTIVLEGITTTLTAEAATALNDTFGVTIFEEGLAIGDVVVRATA